MGFLDNIRRVTPYVPGEQPKGKVIKLNTNECPYPPSPKVRAALQGMDIDLLRKYPDPDAFELTHAIAEYYGLKDSQVFVGVGSDDVLSQCFLAFFAGKRPILFPDITYSFYDVWAQVYDIPYFQIPLKDDFSLNAEAFLRENGGIVIANPNAPTGVAESLETLEEIIKGNTDSVVIVDEAYIDFGGETALPLLQKYENLIITRTMSKSRALAGLRVGYAFGNETLIKCLKDVKFSINSYTMNLPAIIMGKAAIEDDVYFREIRDRVVATRERSKEHLRDMGFSFQDSKANFIFAKRGAGQAEEVFRALRDKDIYVRYFNKPVLRDYLRISIGTDEEMDIFFRELKECL
ncbi:MAG: histidinol-phosphate transaminase [Lachnospiraceae bacterium]|nr:histidinol-phosphate transaminase [Lachnospiraceae bacterium]